MYRNPPVASLVRRIGLSFVLGFGLFGLGVLVNAVLERHQVGGMSLYLDDVLLGVLAGLLVFFYEQRRHRAMIRVIAEMNHHVRNALQAIAFSPYADKAKQIQLIDESAQRIQWALREILPGEVEQPPAPGARTVAH
jgi:hypothetical protein